MPLKSIAQSIKGHKVIFGSLGLFMIIISSATILSIKKNSGDVGPQNTTDSGSMDVGSANADPSVSKLLSEISDLRNTIGELKRVISDKDQKIRELLSRAPGPVVAQSVTHEEVQPDSIPQEEVQGEEIVPADMPVEDTELYKDPSPYVNMKNAIQNHDLAALKKMLDGGYDVNTKSEYNSTPLHLAAYHENLEAVKLLLERGAMTSTLNYSSYSPLHFAKTVEVAKLIVEKGGDPNALNSLNESPIYYATNIELASYYKELGADINQKNHEGRSPLYRVQSTDLLEWYLKNGATVDMLDNKGMTPLDAAIKDNNTEKAELLKKHGARPATEEEASKAGAGIGIDLQMQDNYPIVTALTSPAATEAGLKEGDVILKISQYSTGERGISTKGVNLNEILSHIEGQENSTVYLTVKDADGNERNVAVVRSHLTQN